MKRQGRGFTLMEVMVTLVILGVVAGLAVPAYFNTVEQGRSNEAKVNLSIIRVGEKVYADNNGGTYWLPAANPCTGAATLTACTAINTALGVDITAQYFDITSITAPGGALSLVAKRNTVAGGTANVPTATMDVNGNITWS